MPNWFYFDKDAKKGPFTSEEFLSLAVSGEIRWETIVETEDGRQTLAKNVKGLFPTQELVTQPFVPIPPGAIPPVAEFPSPPGLNASEGASVGLSISASPGRTSFILLRFLLFGCCVLCFLFSAIGIYFAMESIHERKSAEEKIEKFLFFEFRQSLANVSEGISNGTPPGTYFADNRLRSLQCTIHSAVAFLLAGMSGMAAIFLFVGKKLLRHEFTK
ncbi:MAG: hypothetical protein Q4D62_03620 [Planctomycetia bacterium]|nr:hypothetical protein [Planctomycetia bacterium]